jgi:hypothetical protein
MTIPISPVSWHQFFTNDASKFTSRLRMLTQINQSIEEFKTTMLANTKQLQLT